MLTVDARRAAAVVLCVVACVGLSCQRQKTQSLHLEVQCLPEAEITLHFAEGADSSGLSGALTEAGFSFELSGPPVWEGDRLHVRTHAATWDEVRSHRAEVFAALKSAVPGLEPAEDELNLTGITEVRVSETAKAVQSRLESSGVLNVQSQVTSGDRFSVTGKMLAEHDEQELIEFATSRGMIEFRLVPSRYTIISGQGASIAWRDQGQASVDNVDPALVLASASCEFDSHDLEREVNDYSWGEEFSISYNVVPGRISAFQGFFQSHPGNVIAITLDAEVISASKNDGGYYGYNILQCSSQEQADRVEAAIRSGPLLLPVKVVESPPPAD